MILTRYLPGGEIRRLFRTADRSRHSAVPRRASSILVSQEPGPGFGKFVVDFSLLGPNYQCSLARTFDDYDQAVRAERDWLEQHWVLEGVHP